MTRLPPPSVNTEFDYKWRNWLKNLFDDAGADASTIASNTVNITTNTSDIATINTKIANSVEHYIYIRDEKAANSAGGDFTSDAWQTRDFNTEVVDTGGNASVASDQITLDAGTYRFAARAPGNGCQGHKARLRNITDTADIAIGSTGFSTSANNNNTYSFVSGRFTIAAAKILELQHRCFLTQAADGFGIAANVGVIEVYSEIEFWKEIG